MMTLLRMRMVGRAQCVLCPLVESAADDIVIESEPKVLPRERTSNNWKIGNDYFAQQVVLEAERMRKIMSDQMAERLWQEEHGFFEKPLTKTQKKALVDDPKVSPAKHAKLLAHNRQVQKHKDPPAEIFDDWVTKDPKIDDHENTD